MFTPYQSGIFNGVECGTTDAIIGTVGDAFIRVYVYYIRVPIPDNNLAAATANSFSARNYITILIGRDELVQQRALIEATNMVPNWLGTRLKAFLDAPYEPVEVEPELTIEKIQVPPPAFIKSIGSTMASITANNMINITATSPMSVISWILSCMRDTPGLNVAYATFQKAIIDSPYFDEAMVSEEMLHSVSGIADAARMKIGDKYSSLPVTTRAILWCIIIDGILKGRNQAKFEASAKRRLRAVGEMTRTPVFQFSITENQVMIMDKLRVGLRSLIKELAAPILNPPEGISAEVAQTMAYIKLMLVGFEMSGFMIIHEFLLMDDKREAHAHHDIQKEMKDYFFMYDEVRKACHPNPMEAYKLMDPNAPLIKTGQIKKLKWLANHWKRSLGDNWADFAEVKDTGGADPHTLQTLLDTKLDIEKAYTVYDKDVSLRINLPIDNEKRVILKGAKKDPFEVFRQIFQQK